jgi:hypothetical protein
MEESPDRRGRIEALPRLGRVACHGPEDIEMVMRASDRGPEVGDDGLGPALV